MIQRRDGLLTWYHHLPVFALLEAAPPPVGQHLRTQVSHSVSITSALTVGHYGATSDTPEPPFAVAAFCADLCGFAPVQRGENAVFLTRLDIMKYSLTWTNCIWAWRAHAGQLSVHWASLSDYFSYSLNWAKPRRTHVEQVSWTALPNFTYVW